MIRTAKEQHIGRCIACATAPFSKESSAFAEVSPIPVQLFDRNRLLPLAGRLSPATDVQLASLAKRRKQTSVRSAASHALDRMKAKRYMTCGVSLACVYILTGLKWYTLPSLLCMLLSAVCSKVTVVQNLPRFTGEAALAESLMAKPNVDVLFSTVVTGYEQQSGTLTGLRLRNEETGAETVLNVDGAFLAVGLVPENDAFAALVQLDDRGYFASGEDCRTATDGVFVAGDCRHKRIRQVVTAAGDGAVAAMAACEYVDSLK